MKVSYIVALNFLCETLCLLCGSQCNKKKFHREDAENQSLLLLNIYEKSQKFSIIETFNISDIAEFLKNNI